MIRRVDNRLILPFEGLLSGLLSCMFGARGMVFSGLIFGVVIATHVRLAREVQSVFRLIGLIATCAVAFPLSMAATKAIGFRSQFLNFSGTSPWAIDSSVLFSGGVVGAAIVCTGILLFLGPQKNLTKFLLKALCISVTCGFLGVFGWSMGERLQGVSWLPRLPPGDNLGFGLYSLYIVWQTGAASLLGLLLSPQ
jgi:hypothetical protein